MVPLMISAAVEVPASLLGECDGAVLLEGQRVCAHAVQEEAVVADHNRSSLQRLATHAAVEQALGYLEHLQSFFKFSLHEPVNRFGGHCSYQSLDIEVVCGLVEQDDIGTLT